MMQTTEKTSSLVITEDGIMPMERRSRVKSLESPSPRRRRLAEDGQVNLCVKYTIFSVNVVFWIIGGTVLAIGIWGMVEKRNLSSGVARLTNVDNTVLAVVMDPMLIFVVVGLLIFLLSFCACLGSLRENTCLLSFFSYSLVFIFVVEIAGGVLVYIYKDSIEQALGKGFRTAIVRYIEDSDLQFIVDEIQMGLKCCGSQTYTDWNDNRYFNCSSPSARACGVPHSCCLPASASYTQEQVLNTQCGFNAISMKLDEARDRIYVRGCQRSIVEWINNNMYLIGGVFVGAVILQIMALCFARKMINDIELIKAYW
ncbi:tetraspanin-17-like isoform X2 [Branchiostoma lanceolatum]|uniref:tetraspanin-17-like isoform X2 n=1 Tax=Branchiostoma lanceolatum TaxID=7740 RepID=UPI00345360A9